MFTFIEYKKLKIYLITQRFIIRCNHLLKDLIIVYIIFKTRSNDIFELTVFRIYLWTIKQIIKTIIIKFKGIMEFKSTSNLGRISEV